jgi:hypothetical protein
MGNTPIAILSEISFFLSESDLGMPIFVGIFLFVFLLGVSQFFYQHAPNVFQKSRLRATLVALLGTIGIMVSGVAIFSLPEIIMFDGNIVGLNFIFWLISIVLIFWGALLGVNQVPKKDKNVLFFFSVFFTCSLFFAFPVFLLVWLGVSSLSERCDRKVSSVFHEFNGHLKNVCIQNKTGFCPKNEGELIAFDPNHYKQLQECAKTYYEYRPETQEFTWIVNASAGVYISNPHNPDAYSVLYLKSSDPETQYPPSFPGPWDKLPK